MGGKKKTKWRKLPLGEFTKECPTTQKIVSKHDCKSVPAVEEEIQPPIPTYEGDIENSNQYISEFGEYTEGMMLPTSYVVYNPVEMPVYPNYMMSTETCCYYYMPPEMTPVQEYAPTMPYQEYVPPMKDTVYLLFPAPALRSSHGLPPIAYDWRNRRRRRRYEGYAEYAVIPNNTNYSSNREERDRGRKIEPNGYRVSDSLSNQAKTTTSISETDVLSRESQKRVQEQTVWKSASFKEEQPALKNMDVINGNKKDIMQENQNHNSNKKEFCSVHTTRGPGKKYTHNDLSEMSPQEKANFPKNIECDVQENILRDRDSTDNQIKSNDELAPKENDVPKQSICKNNVKDSSWIQNESQNIFDNESKEDLSKPVNLQPNFRNISPILDIPVGNSAEELENDSGSDSLPGNKECTKNDVSITAESSSLEENNEQSIEQKEGNKETATQLKFTSPPVPDISITLRNTVPYDTSEKTDLSCTNNNFDSYDKMNQENEKIIKSNVVMSAPSHFPYPFKSNVINQDTGFESSKLQSLQSLRANQSLYKFAYDENITDQSSSSPSPMDPELHVPSSIINNEIIVHEADTDSDAGSEDVELIPHRYESESFLNGNKHVYVNKLSLAVELLRTRESLPYDAQFKRVVVDSIETSQEETGEVNFGFMEDSYSLHSLEEQSDIVSPDFPQNTIVTDQAGIVHVLKDESAMKSISLRDSSLEIAKEVVPPETGIHKDDDVEEGTGVRRRGPFHPYFTPRAALVNPCLCCCIM